MRHLNKLMHDAFYRQTVIVFLIKVISSILGFSTTVLLVKNLGGETSSAYFFLIALSSVLTALSTFGAPEAILKFTAINRNVGKLVKLVVKNACLLSIVFSLVITFILFVVNKTVELSSEELFILSIIVVLPLSSIILLLSSALQGAGRIIIAMITTGFVQNIVLLSSLTFFADSYFDAACAFALGNLLASVIAIYYLNKDLNDENESFDTHAFKSTCKSMLVSQSVVQYNNHAAILLLGVLWVGKDISIMAVSLKLTTMLSFIIIAVNRVLAPQIAVTYKNGDLVALQHLISKSSRLMWILCVPAVFIIMLFSQQILMMIDESYPSQYLVLIVLALGQLVNVITGNIGLLLSMTGHEKIQKNILLCALFISLILGYFLIPSYGPLGAAIMTTGTVIIVNVSSYFYVLIKLKLNTLKLL